MHRRVIGLGWLAVCAVLALSRPCTAADQWLEARSPNFRVVTTGSANDAREVAANFERLRAVLGKTTRVSTRADVPLTIVAVKSGKHLRTLLGTDRDDIAGAFAPGPDAHVALVRLDMDRESRYQVAYHEYLHVLVHQSMGVVPLWLNEGIAELYAHARLTSDKVLVGVPASYHLAILQEEVPLPLETLLTVTHESRHYNESDRASIFYAQSWALTHFLMLGDGGVHRARLFVLMEALDSGMPVRDAAAKAFGDVKEFERQFRAYISRFQFPALTDVIPVDDSLKQLQPSTLSPGQVLALQATVSATFGHGDARALAAQAVSLEPNLADAWVAQARAARQQGDADAVRTSLEKAIALGATDPLVHFGWAELQVMRAPADHPLDDVAAALERSLAGNADLARALSLLAYVRMRQDRHIDRAFGLVKKAIELEPGNARHYLTLASVLYMTRDRALVAQALERATLLARSDDERERVAEARSKLQLP